MSKPSQSITDTNFSELILGFSSAALHYLGLEQIDGVSPEKANKELALYNIKIIELLQEKTKGNLTKEESELMAAVLSNLKNKI